MTPADRAQFRVLIKATRALAEDVDKTARTHGLGANDTLFVLISYLGSACLNMATMLEMLVNEAERGSWS